MSDPDTITLAATQHIGYGNAREQQEDTCAAQVVTTRGGAILHVGVIADGIGGSNHGEVASQLAVEAALETLGNAAAFSDPIQPLVLVEKAVVDAHAAILQAVVNNSTLRGMGTTLLVAVVVENRLYLAWVGDSRAYLVRQDKVFLLTLDHSWSIEMVREGRFSVDEVKNHSRRDELMRYIGQPVELRVEHGYRMLDPNLPLVTQATQPINAKGLELQAGDTVVLCSDGLVKPRRKSPGHFVEPQEMAKIIASRKNKAGDTANALIKKALERKADDNISVVVLDKPGPRSLVRGIKQLLGERRVQIGLGAFVGLILLIVLAIWLWPGGFSSPATPTPFLPTLENPVVYTPIAGQIYISDLRGDVGVSIEGQPESAAFSKQYLPVGEQTRVRTGIDGWARLEFPDGTTVIVDNNSTVILLAVSGNNQPYNQVNIDQGRVFVRSPQQTVVRSSLADYRGEITTAVMGLVHSSGSGQFEVYCLQGPCQVVGGRQYTLQSGEAALARNWAFSNNFSTVDYSPWLTLAGDLVPQPTNTPFSAPGQTATPNLASPTSTPTRLNLPARSATPTPTPLPSMTPTPTLTLKPGEPTYTPQPTNTRTRTPTVTRTGTITPTPTPSPTRDNPNNRTRTPTPTPTFTDDPLEPTATPTETETPEPTQTPTDTEPPPESTPTVTNTPEE
jgi:protein phosphatase